MERIKDLLKPFKMASTEDKKKIIAAVRTEFENLRKAEEIDYVLHEILIYDAFDAESMDLLILVGQIAKKGKIHTPFNYTWHRKWPEGWLYLSSLILENCCQKCGLLKS
jgi:hypothetical protein